MAITPDQAQNLTQVEKETIDFLERHFDRILKERFNGEKVAIDVPSQLFGKECRLTARVIDSLEHLYKQAGWIAKHNYDQKDGSWFEFAPINNP